MLILGTEYDLITDDETLTEIHSDGECLLYSKIIRIRPVSDMLDDSASYIDKKKRYNETLRHEIVHAFFNECALDHYGRDEELVEWIAVQFPKMLKVFQELSCTD